MRSDSTGTPPGVVVGGVLLTSLRKGDEPMGTPHGGDQSHWGGGGGGGGGSPYCQ